jgi:hypothetical protein
VTIAANVEKLLSIKAEMAHTIDRVVGVGQDLEDYENGLGLIIGENTPVFQSIAGDISIMLGAKETLVQGMTNMNMRIQRIADEIASKNDDI